MRVTRGERPQEAKTLANGYCIIIILYLFIYLNKYPLTRASETRVPLASCPVGPPSWARDHRLKGVLADVIPDTAAGCTRNNTLVDWPNPRRGRVSLRGLCGQHIKKKVDFRRKATFYQSGSQSKLTPVPCCRQGDANLYPAGNHFSSNSKLD